jgi:hypothetical protein
MDMNEKRVLPTSIMGILLLKDQNMSVQNRKMNMAKIQQTWKVAPAYATRERDDIYVPDISTFSTGYNVLKDSSLPSKTKEVVFETLNRTIWTNNKAFKSGRKDTSDCEKCGRQETMEHLLYNCPHYSMKVWEEYSGGITQLTEWIKGEPIARIQLTPREIIYNACHPGMALHYKNNDFCNILRHLIQEIKRDIVYRRMNIMESQKYRDTPLVRIQAHILTNIGKLTSLLSYQGLMKNKKHIAHLVKLKEIIQDRIQ